MVTTYGVRSSTSSNLQVVAGVVIGAAAFGLAGLLLAAGYETIAIVCAVLGFSAVPLRVLPSLALLVWLLIPHWLFTTYLLRDIGLGPIILTVWVIRVSLVNGLSRPKSVHGPITHERSWRSVVFLAGLLLIWVLLSRQVSSFDPKIWVASFIMAFVLPCLVSGTSEGTAILWRTWQIAGSLVGVCCLLEHVLGESIVYGSLYVAPLNDPVQHWSVYRSVFSFTHPLYAGTFLACSTVLLTGRCLILGTSGSLVAAALTFGGLVSTVSRGPIVACAVGALTVAIVLSRQKGRSVRRRARILIGVIVVSTLVVLNLSIITARNGSVEASDSLGARLDIFRLAIALVRALPWTGSGPGTSSQYSIMSSRLVLENSWLQILVSLGVIGLLLFAAYAVFVLRAALACGKVTVFAAILTYLICLSTFNGIDDAPSLHLLFGFLLVLARRQKREREGAGEHPTSFEALNAYKSESKLV